MRWGVIGGKVTKNIKFITKKKNCRIHKTKLNKVYKIFDYKIWKKNSIKKIS